MNFWVSLQRGEYGRKEEGGQMLVVLWAIWIPRNEVMFRGRPAFTHSVLHEIEGLMGFWFPQVPEGDVGQKQV